MPVHVTVRARGAIVLPIESRRRLGLEEPGAVLEVRERDDGVIELWPVELSTRVEAAARDAERAEPGSWESLAPGERRFIERLFNPIDLFERYEGESDDEYGRRWTMVRMPLAQELYQGDEARCRQANADRARLVERLRQRGLLPPASVSPCLP